MQYRLLLTGAGRNGGNKMIKKVVKVFLVLLMVFGAFIAASNMLEPNLNGATAWVYVKYHKNIPDCFGAGTTCLDMTTTPPTEN